GYQVNVLVQYSAADTTKPASYRSKPSLKVIRSSKLSIIDIDSTDRCGFIKCILDVHDYGIDYSPGVHFGPPFKMSWTGSSGGKAGAPTIETDTDFAVILASLKKKKDPAVVVEYNLDDMDGYRVSKKRVSFSAALPQDGEEEGVELLYGTKVPRVDDFTPQDQLHGSMILKLKGKWPCDKHQGESGDVGHCWIDVGGNHTGLNMRKLKMWSSAIVAGEATIHEPPNVIEFDGLRDGRLTRPRGRGGPRPSAGPSDITAVLLAAMLPLLHNMTPRTSDPLKTPPRTALPVVFPATPTKKPMVPLSPIPPPSSELHACLDDFFKLKGINLLETESVFASLELTPEIIADVPVSRLGELTGVIEGRLWGFQSFCREWSSRLQEKKRR
ncbi:hypothetical protein B0H17DRAFT_867710, partial [Mycena rosella]